MFPPSCIIRLGIVCIQVTTLLGMVPAELLAVQIEPNPNPELNTITITPSAPRENLVSFSNLGTINIEPLASFHNANQLDNSGVINNRGTITNSGTFTEVVRPFPHPGGGILLLPQGSQFINLASGVYNSGDVTTGIGGTFVNEGAVKHGLGHITVGETGQYIQRQAVGSSVTPTTITPDGPFNNAGRVQISAGDFNIDPISIRAAVSRYEQTSTGTTQIDARFQNIGGEVRNAGTITVGSTGEYRQQGTFGPVYTTHTGLTTNAGTFINAGTTNINTGAFQNDGNFRNNAGQVRIGDGRVFSSFPALTGVFQNNGDFRNNAGQVTIAEGALFSNTRSGTAAASGLYIQENGIQGVGQTRIHGGFDNRGSVSIEGTFTVGATGVYTQSPSSPDVGATTRNTGTFQNEGRVSLSGPSSFFNTGQYVQLASGRTEIGGTFVNLSGQMSNAGAITVGTTGQYLQDRMPGSNTPLPSRTNNSGIFTNAGQVHISEGTVFSNFPTLPLGGLPAVGGEYIQQAGGTTQIDGVFLNSGGKVTNEGAMTVGATGTYNQTRSSAPVPGTPTTVNIGAITNAGNTLINAGTFTNQGSLVNSGTVQIGGNGAATLTNQGIVVNTGTFQVTALGQVAGTGSYVQNAAAAQTIVNGTFAHNISLQAGSLSGTGTIAGAVMNTGGVVRPGNSIVPGTLTLANYTQGVYGRLDLKIGGLLTGSQYDVLKVTGSGTFGGRLSVSLINGFAPGLGNRFELLTCSLGCSGLNGGTLFGGGVSLPSLASGLAWMSGLSDGGNSFSLTVVASAATAPEPGTLLLVASGLVGLAWWRWKQAKAVVTHRP